MGTFTFVKDSRQRWPSTLTSTAVDDLSTATAVKVFMWLHTNKAIKIDGATATILSADTNTISVEYAPTAEDVDTVGIYDLQWEVTFPGSIPVRFPSDEPDTIDITEKIAA